MPVHARIPLNRAARGRRNAKAFCELALETAARTLHTRPARALRERRARRRRGQGRRVRRRAVRGERQTLDGVRRERGQGRIRRGGWRLSYEAARASSVNGERRSVTRPNPVKG